MALTTYLPFLSIDWSMIFMLCNTLILFLLMKHFFFEKVKKVIDDREKEVQGIFDDASQTKADAQALKSSYDESLKGAKAEAAQIVSDAQKRAQAQADEIVKEAQAKTVVMIAKADEEIKREKTKAMNELKNEISTIALDIASKVVEKDINAKDHERLIEGFIDSVGEV